MSEELTSTHKCPSCGLPLRKQETVNGSIILWCPHASKCKSTVANDGFVAATEADAFEGLKANVEKEEQENEE